MANGSDERRRAARLLTRVDDGAFASRLLDHESSPGVRSRVLGVLRWRRRIDHDLTPWLSRPLERLDPEVRTALRLGVFEATRLGVPPPVATDAMVRVTRGLRKSSAAGMVNAVLRRALAAAPPSGLPPDLEWSHPEWLFRRWTAAFGTRDATAAMASAQEPAPPWAWFLDESAAVELEQAGVLLQPHPWCEEAWTADEGLPALMARVTAGSAVVQDPSSQLVARVAVSTTGGRGRAVDLCAAPGGKTALMARIGSWDGLVAADLSPAKAVRLANRLEGPSVIAADASRPPLRSHSRDVVLLDAPCSGSGTFRRHPELKWRLAPESIAEAATRQRPLIEAALELLAPDGVLVYATCSVELEENEAHFVELPDRIARVDLTAHLPDGLAWNPTVAGGVRILPHEWGDGFTVHALRRR